MVALCCFTNAMYSCSKCPCDFRHGVDAEGSAIKKNKNVTSNIIPIVIIIIICRFRMNVIDILLEKVAADSCVSWDEWYLYFSLWYVIAFS